MGRKIPVLGLEARVLESIVDGGRFGNGWKSCSRRGWRGRKGGGGVSLEGTKGLQSSGGFWDRCWPGEVHRWAGCVSGAQNPHAPAPSSSRRKHVAALLDIRGLRNTAARHEILAVARDLELSEGKALSPSRDRAFFADIPVPRPPFCLGLPLFLGRLPVSQLARPSLACLPRLRPPSPSWPRSQR